MDYLLVALGAALLGALSMHLSYRRAAFARKEERAAGMKIQLERDAAYASVQQLLQDAAHDAGWREGYQAAQDELTAKDTADGIMGMIDTSLRNGRPVAVGFGVTNK